MADKGPIICISDLHGNLDLLRRAISKGLDLAGRCDLEVILLGDYCDNGLQVVELLEYLSKEKWKDDFPGVTLRGILGNHDMACLLALNPGEFGADPNFLRRGKNRWEMWSQRFWTPGGETAHQYGSTTQEEFLVAFPSSHRNFLRSLPWYIESDQYIFVHAGLRKASEESVESQLKYLSARNLSDMSGHTYGGGNYGIPDQLAHKGWCRDNDPEWKAVVVTGHNKYVHYSEDTGDSHHFVSSHRIGFHSCACSILMNSSLPLHAALLPRGPKGSTVWDYPPIMFSVRYDLPPSITTRHMPGLDDTSTDSVDNIRQRKHHSKSS